MYTNNDNNNTSNTDDLVEGEGKIDPGVLQSSYEYAGTRAITNADVLAIINSLQRSVDSLAQTNLLMLQLMAKKQGLALATPNSIALSVQDDDNKSDTQSVISDVPPAKMNAVSPSNDIPNTLEL
jgi:hypothetical protein